MVSSGEMETNPVLWRLVQGPKHTVKTYKKYRVNGFVFSTKYHDDTVVTQDSGVCMKALTTFRAKKVIKGHWMLVLCGMGLSNK